MFVWTCGNRMPQQHHSSKTSKWHHIHTASSNPTLNCIYSVTFGFTSFSTNKWAIVMKANEGRVTRVVCGITTTFLATVQKMPNLSTSELRDPPFFFFFFLQIEKKPSRRSPTKKSTSRGFFQFATKKKIKKKKKGGLLVGSWNRDPRSPTKLLRG